jgi:hypothetical protein
MRTENGNLVTPARVAALVAYIVSIALPSVDPDTRALIVGAVTGLYILAVAAVEVADRKRRVAGVVSSPAPASEPRNVTDVTVATDKGVGSGS